MMKGSATFAIALLGLASLFSLTALRGQTAQPEKEAPAPDYSKTVDWVCRPGSDSVCTTGLDSRVFYPDGHQETHTFSPAANPAIDCFYVYPTVSREDREYADLEDSPEIQQVVKSQAGRLTSRCRVFAPIYRQATMKQLRDHMSGQPTEERDTPFQDVSAAWNYYLQHDNKGRGVVLIGHSQGTILLQRLIAASIDGAPSQKLIVSAFLAGDPSLGVPPGKLVGGTLHHMPLCQSAAQTGCVYAWGSFLEGAQADEYYFGGPRKDGLESACNNPSSPGGGKATLKPVLTKPQMAPEADPPYIETPQQLAGSCVTAGNAHIFSVSVLPGPFAQRFTAALGREARHPGWGLHPIDIGLVQGNILDTLDAEISSWRAAPGH